MEIEKIILDFTSQLPNTDYIIGYGSFVKKQEGYNENEYKQIDLIIAVDDPKTWHMQNIKLNPRMYSITSKMFFNYLDEKYQSLGADICYLPYVRYKNNDFKIGIISTENLLQDLNKWKNFYMAGRLTKDVLLVKKNAELIDGIEYTRNSALNLSLLLMNEKNPTLKELYKKLYSLSYLGDSRKNLKAEDPNKINNLVNGNYEELKKIYIPDKYKFDIINDNENININIYNILQESNYFPVTLKEFLTTNGIKYDMILTKEELEELRNGIILYFESINSKSSTGQTIKGILTAGPAKSIKYGYQKLMKYQKGKKATK